MAGRLDEFGGGRARSVAGDSVTELGGERACDIALVGAGVGVLRAAACRYRDDVVTVLAAQALALHDALEQVATEGCSHVVLDGTVFRTDRCAETSDSTKGETIHAWYSRNRAPGGHVQTVMRRPAPARSGYSARCAWSASQLGLPTLADSDSDSESAGQGVPTPIKQPGNGHVLAPHNQTYNSLLRAVRCRGERGFAGSSQKRV